MARSRIIKDQVHFVITNREVNVVAAIDRCQDHLVHWVGQGDKGYKKACQLATSSQVVHQVSVGINGTRLLYSY